MRSILYNSLAREVTKMSGPDKNKTRKKPTGFFRALAVFVLICTLAGYGAAALPYPSAASQDSVNAVIEEISEQTCRDCYNQVAATCAGKNDWDKFWCGFWEDLKCSWFHCPSGGEPVPGGP